ncbi:nucleoside-diphosphate sugar epimerase/dehydratase [Chryseobacterium sp. ES2]|uniref:Nucleoside-diphosphate sugar epimerase/dehydratase n=1 Tax=Chryseobacterium metallicongregator TaxID=3073042 RepID=A0ABU1E0U2_9FLAO|nr:nucleoside-diphosphate sugar epimerase/dehydratase [Chryseobacterium sp. ES2]MDR4951381.1 nucleoside-diphosphate sugar epimerase/dehydratase [Chryseobacterium sp. ES2]
MGNVFKIRELRYIPRWSVFLIDISVIFFSILVSYFLLNSLEVKLNFIKYQKEKIFSVLLINILCIVLFKTYAGIIRHSTFFDFFKIVWSSGSALIVLLGLNFMSELILGKPVFLYPVLFLFFFISIFLMFFFRMAIKELFGVLIDSKDTPSKARIAIVGVEDTSVSLAKAIIHNPDHPYQLAGFLSARSDSKKARLLGHKIYSKKQFLRSDTLKEQFDAVLIKDVMTKREIEEWTSFALDKGLKVLKVPVTNIIKEDDKVRSIRPLQIEDLLNRPTIKIENNEVRCFHVNKNILVTGGAGSIGSEIVRQVAQLNSSLIVVVDQAESPLYELQLDLLERFPNQRFKFILADISNYSRMEKLFDDYQFSIVYHAAAYKHVPLIEDNPHEAIFVNIGGTKNVALLSKKYNVNRFVMVSTDKAVNPTNVMGASKRAAELFVQSLQNSSENTTKFITTRFGNVLGSNGSVIPHFKKQIEKGGPVTITHPDIIRYFMTIPEACELVLQAGTMGQGGEIYVFDMGKPVKILDLAERMIKLSGYTPGIDIKIDFIGLRPGEKLYEELLTDNSTTIPTHHEKIMISRDPLMKFEDIDILCKQIILSAMNKDSLQIVRILKIIVPEFKSNNSEFEILDKISEHKAYE